jgi:nicotinate-nucleotide pyrophosphorylase (carboxylating)
LTETQESVELEGAFERVLEVALIEDLGEGGLEADVTTHATIPENLWGTAVLVAKQDGVVCGLPALRTTYRLLDDRVEISLTHREGDDVTAGDQLASVTGPVRPILVGERTALNLVGHLSGVATLVRSFARAVTEPGRTTTLVDTRKTLPGLRLLQKYAVRTGGASNHRFALWDGVLIKDTHVAAAGGVGEAVRRARAGTTLPVQAECTSLAEVEDALEAGAHALLLDNQGAEELTSLVEHVRARSAKEYVLIEASGGVTLENVAAVASTGVDRISVGAFTHSAPALDVSMRLQETWPGGPGDLPREEA